LIRDFLAEYAAVPEAFRSGEMKWNDAGRAGETFAEVLDPREARRRAREGAREGAKGR
jgi:hypothetical protein